MAKTKTNRPIRFRGKCIRTGKWYYGFLCGNDVIKSESSVRLKVDPKTVGQFIRTIGTQDLYEGDIVHESGAYILWSERLMCWCFNHPGHESNETPLFYEKSLETITIIGNIYDGQNK